MDAAESLVSLNLRSMLKGSSFHDIDVGGSG